MKYNSVGEYFYRLSNRCLGLVLLPILLILSAYFFAQYFSIDLTIETSTEDLLVELMTIELGISILLIGAMQLKVSGKLKALRIEPSLSNRMSGYIPIVMIRFQIFSFMVFIIGTCVFLTVDILPLAPFPIIVILILLYWPFHSRMARDLKLKPQERDILKSKSMGV